MEKWEQINIWKTDTNPQLRSSVLSNPWEQVDNFKTLFSPVNSRIGKLRIYVKLKHVEQELFVVYKSQIVKSLSQHIKKKRENNSSNLLSC